MPALSLSDYKTYISTLPGNSGIYYNCYRTYESLWDDYIVSIVVPNLIGVNIQEVGLILMESAPKLKRGQTHPHPNYIFNPQTAPNRYFKNIYNGFQSINSSGVNKRQKLIDLLRSNNNKFEIRPIILMDLFHTHGMMLTSYKRKKLNQLSDPIITKGIDDKLSYINSHLLISRGLCFHNLKVIFASPPTSCGVCIPTYLKGKGLQIPDCKTVNTIGNGIAPSSTEIQRRVLKGF